MIAQFANDTQLFQKTRKAVETVINILAQMETQIGLKVNYEKSSIHCINNAHKFACDKPIVWDPGGATVLGIDVKKKPPRNIL